MSSTKRTNIKRKKRAPQKTELFSPVAIRRIFQNKLFHFTAICLFTAASYVLVRMKTVEVRYEVSKIKKELKKVEDQNKILKAKKAELLAPNRMRKLANEFNLQTPKENQVISIK